MSFAPGTKACARAFTAVAMTTAACAFAGDYDYKISGSLVERPQTSADQLCAAG